MQNKMLQFMNGFAYNNSQKFLTKIVVRRLPPDFTLEIFKDQVSPIPPHTYLYFAKDGNDGPYTFSRAYVNFLYHNDLLDFKEKYDNYIFLGRNGT